MHTYTVLPFMKTSVKEASSKWETVNKQVALFFQRTYYCSKSSIGDLFHTVHLLWGNFLKLDFYWQRFVGCGAQNR